MGIRIVGTGMYVPKFIIDNNIAVINFALHDKFLTDSGKPITAEGIKTLTGIERRHKATKNQNTSDLAVLAANEAIKNAGIYPDDLDFIIVGSSTHERNFPATACLVQNKLEIKNKCVAFDISAACASFTIALEEAYFRFMSKPDCNYGLIIGSEVILSRMADWENLDADFWGDGAGAVVLKRVSENTGIIATDSISDGTLADITESKGMGTRAGDRNIAPDSWMDGHAVYKFALKLIPEMIEKITAKANIQQKDIVLVVPHQANARIIEASIKKLDIPYDKFFMNIENYGNTSSASIPIALHEALIQGRIKPGDLVLLLGFGGGMSACSILLRW